MKMGPRLGPPPAIHPRRAPWVCQACGADAQSDDLGDIRDETEDYDLVFIYKDFECPACGSRWSTRWLWVGSSNPE